MRNFLLGGVAVVAVLLAAPVARAEMDVTVGGFSAFRMGFFDNKAANQTGRDFSQEAEVHIRADGKADNGLEYGAKVELYASTSDVTNADEAGLYLKGDWGRLELGDDDGASDQLSVVAPTVGIGQINGRYLDFVPSSSRPSGNVKDTGGGIIKPLDTDDATKVTYYTPRVYGFQAGISYAPEVGSMSDGEQVQFLKDVGAGPYQQDYIETGLNYRGKYQDFGFLAGFAFDTADAKAGSGREDVNAWGLGGRVTYKGFAYGGGYVDNGDSNNPVATARDDETAWNVGATYKDGAWGVAVNYLAEDYETAGGRSGAGGTYDAVVFGGTYKIADGLTTSADLAFFDRDKVTGTDDDGYVFVLETKASF